MEVAIVFFPLAAAIILVYACAGKTDVRHTLPVGPPNWDFAKSFATNIAIFGGVIGIFFSNKIVESPRFVTDPGYPMLSALFAVLALVGPLVFLVLSGVKRRHKNGSWELQYQGTAGGFLLATLFTLWAGFGQLFTLASLASEVLNAGKAPHVSLDFLVILIVAAVMIALYAWRTAAALLVGQQEVQVHAGKEKADLMKAGAVKEEDDPTLASLPGWSLL